MNSSTKFAVSLGVSLFLAGCLTSPPLPLVKVGPPPPSTAQKLLYFPSAPSAARSKAFRGTRPKTTLPSAGILLRLNDGPDFLLRTDLPLQVIPYPPHVLVLWTSAFPHWQVEYSTDLQHWLAIEEGEALDTHVLYLLIDSEAMHLAERRFYRLRALP